MARPAPAPLYTLRGAGSALNALQFRCCGGDTPLLFSGSAQGSVHVWNLITRRAGKVLDGHSGASVIWLNTLLSRDSLISQGRDMRVCQWDLAEGRSDVTDSVWTGSVGFCRCSLLETGPGRWLLAHPGEAMEEVKVIELPSRQPVCSLVPQRKPGMVMCINLWQPDSGPGPLLLAGYEDGSLAVWDVSLRSVLSRVAAHPEPVMCLAFDPTGQRGVSGSSEKSLSSWTLDGQHRLQVSEAPGSHSPRQPWDLTTVYPGGR
ncbi:guanine nucleotide-binding protein subunit beta-like protein 1 isoform X2 [Esox lucius]|uniref:guanine nucleotide-binding protein subunit beta-like protein 1 isoform X2 n=1 Tax=Esox lucius TaxID=8010 RepID=UPI0014774679|nr:guanine nucleotide-binding protein subunit beta-like protein 1 isoform X2 [Esox lucius]